MNFFSNLRAWLVYDFGWKIFSILLAVAIWLTVHKVLLQTALPVVNTGGSTLTYGNLPVLVVATAADVHLYRIVPETVKVTVSGSPEVIGKLQANQIRATVDLTGIDSAKELKRAVDVSVPAGATVVSVEPARVGVIVPPLSH
jgi:YbbR domain-containing protein